MVGATSRYLMCTPMKMRLSTARMMAARMVPVKGGGEDERDGADEFDYAEDCPCIARQGAEGGDVVAYLVEQEDFHDARG